MSNLFSFMGGAIGPWRVTSMTSVKGDGLETVERIQIVQGAPGTGATDASWILQGTVSNLRYAKAAEVVELRAIQPALRRPQATCAALIPIRKSPQWWEMAQDQRRAIFEETSHHTAIGMDYLPAIARQLHHSRDLEQPFDFLTWFEYAPEDSAAFEALVTRLRATREWDYVERECDIRLQRHA